MWLIQSKVALWPPVYFQLRSHIWQLLYYNTVFTIVQTAISLEWKDRFQQRRYHIQTIISIFIKRTDYKNFIILLEDFESQFWFVFVCLFVCCCCCCCFFFFWPSTPFDMTEIMGHIWLSCKLLLLFYHEHCIFVLYICFQTKW